MGNHEIDKKGDKQQIAMPQDYNCNNRDNGQKYYYFRRLDRLS